MSERDENRADAPLQPLEDDALDAVSGGYDVVFQDNGVNRDSWFVSLVTRRMIQNSIRSYLASGDGSVPEIITVGDRRFRVRKVGENYYVEAL